MPNAGRRVPGWISGRSTDPAPVPSALGVWGARALLVLCAAAAAWAAVVALTGGFSIDAGAVRIRSRQIGNPLAAALLSGLGALALWLRNPRCITRRQWTLLPLLGVALTGAGVRVHHWAIARPLWLDEQMIAINIRERALPDLAGGLWLAQSAPFGWLAAQRAAFLSFGDGERALRLVPLVFALAVLGAALWVARRWMGAAGAAVLVVLFTFGQWVTLYSHELKHYSADIFWSLLVAALAAWAVDRDVTEPKRLIRRAAVWWVTAAVGLWFANGAMLVVPGCSIVMAILIWRRAGLRVALAFATVGMVWLASFQLHYLIAIRHALSSSFLSGYWAFAVAPETGGLAAKVNWSAGQLESFAVKPGGSGFWLLFWGSAAAGWAFTRQRTLGLMMATLPLFAFVLAWIRVVPFFERLSLWVLPAFYVGIALLADVAVRLLRRRGSPAVRWNRALIGCLAGAAVLIVCTDVVTRGAHEIRVGRHPASNHELDDRSGVRWLMKRRTPGSVTITTHLGLPALWWYGGLNAAEPVIEVRYLGEPEHCRGHRLADLLPGYQRALVHLGFRFDDVPKGFDELLMEELESLGTLVALRHFAGVGRGMVFELQPGGASAAKARPAERTVPRLAGCIAALPGRRW